MIRIRKYSRLEVHDTEMSSSLEDMTWSMSKSMSQCRNRWPVPVSTKLRRESLNRSILASCSQEAKRPWLDTSQSLSSVTTKTLEELPKDKQKLMACSLSLNA